MFRRGFKSWSEEVALRLRREQGLSPAAPIDYRRLATSLGVPILSPNDLSDVPEEVRRRLLGEFHSSWSAITVSVGKQSLIVYNTAHSAPRQATDVVHELAHLLLEHRPAMVFMNPAKALLLRTYDPGQEDEASWLGGCVLLPRPALLAAGRRRDSVAAIAAGFGVSEELVRYRQNVSGVTRQLTRRRKV